MGIFKRVWLWAALLGITLLSASENYAQSSDENFSNYEIRTIRPRFFQKTHRFELGAGLLAVVNNPFVYTFMASGLMTFHLSEAFALEANVAYGTSFDRGDKEVLFDDFNIKTEVFRTEYTAEGGLVWTPLYGKLQIPKGRFVYFDTFTVVGGGMTGVDWQYSDMCVTPNRAVDKTTPDPPTNKTASYPDVMYGVGQRIFRDRSIALRWDLRGHTIFYDAADAGCSPSSGDSASTNRTNITLQIGASKFF